ncbi:MAG TPA: patatin-like phospholipase family protein [Baekduia sp.]|uniref:patatin-like phospholipase family protein n=1 Tax=Baekduia sp. TaxID=2600305 RepID=UPI002C62B4B9|nr:patatin-like phospholipase family protein [Baekduia sp.]HMJ33170.1 patatin-like phospholipase family protein [Baekduia sp.]
MPSSYNHRGAPPRVALVLPGGGARGAYEVGALSVLLPLLEERGERPVILCGTSVGAINATALGATADRPAAEAVASLIEHWRGLRKADVIRPVVGLGLPLTALRMLGEALEVPGVRLAGLLDPAPLRRSLNRWIDWDALHRNVRTGVIEAACVVATSLDRAGPVAFVDSVGRVPASRAADSLQYVPARLGDEHVRASAAIPVLFPPVEIAHPAALAGYYVDGGTRLNSPVAPALALGADRVVVIGFQPFRAQVEPPTKANGSPRLADVAANIIDGLLVDQVADDLRRLATINSFVVDAHGPGPRGAADAYRAARGRKPYRRISYALVAPERRGELAAVADEVFDDRYAGLQGWLRPDYPFMSRLLGGGRSPSRGELLSFLLFDEDHIDRLIELGRADARRWLDRHPSLWCSDAAHDFDIDATAVASLREREALDEWRNLRRRP